MALIRGLRGKYPCPICFVKQEDMWNLLDESPLYTTELSVKIVLEARQKVTKTQAEEILKNAGLRNINVSISGLCLTRLTLSYFI